MTQLKASLTLESIPDLPDLCYRVLTAIVGLFLQLGAVSFRVLSAPGIWDCVCLLTFAFSVTSPEPKLLVSYYYMNEC